MPGQLIRSGILDGAADLIRAHGARPGSIARAAGIPRSALTDPDLLISAPAVLRFFDLAAQACRLPNWGLTLGSHGRLAAIIGPLWVLLRNARTIGEMCTELADNFDLYSDAAMVSLERTPEGVLFNWTTTAAGRIDSEVQMAEFSLRVFANEIRSHLHPDWMPSAVLFRHARPPGQRTRYRKVFGAHVRFNQDRNSLLLDERTWTAPLKARGSAARALVNRVVRLDEERPGKRMAHSVEAVIRSLMPYAPCTVGEVGRALDLPARTLQFRLKQEGTSFTQVRDVVRADLASKYLRHSDLSATRIAEILGYADLTSLSRSFRRWNGVSLRQQRRSARRSQ